MDIIITGIICLGAGLAIGGAFWGHYADTVKAQAEEIDALQSDNLRLRGQAAELATMAHTADAEAQEALAMAKKEKERADNLIQDCVVLGDIVAADQGSVALLEQERKRSAELNAEVYEWIDKFLATKRKLSAAKGQITKLKRRTV